MTGQKNGTWLGIVIVLVLAGLGYWYMKMYPSAGTLPSQSTSSAQMVKNEVSIRNNTFVPDSMTIKKGETVTWVNNETYGHDVVSDDGTFKSDRLATGEKYSYTFMNEGTYTYMCSIHPFMKATIIVTK